MGTGLAGRGEPKYGGSYSVLGVTEGRPREHWMPAVGLMDPGWDAARSFDEYDRHVIATGRG
jgi:hypothetical protein